MSSESVMSQYTASPDAALEAVRAYEGPLLIDLDETLYLRNSTEDFIDCARPGLLALLLLRVLDVLKPWRLTGARRSPSRCSSRRTARTCSGRCERSTSRTAARHFEVQLIPREPGRWRFVWKGAASMTAAVRLR